MNDSIIFLFGCFVALIVTLAVLVVGKMETKMWEENQDRKKPASGN